MKPTWQSPKTAPRNGTLIMADFGYPWPCLAVWNSYEEKWTSTMFNAQEMENGKTDSWWETELESDYQLQRWLPMPRPENKP